MSEQTQEVAKKTPKFSVVLQNVKYQKLINNTLADPRRAQRFIASISSAVACNPSLQECDAGTIISCALLGESLELSPSPQLGQYYLVPFKDKQNDRKAATFILGYKGYIQLAIRSGLYKRLNVMEIKKGELVHFDPLTEEIEVNLIEDELQREIAETIGYYATFEYINGFRKAIYWSKEKMTSHAEKYSKAFASSSSFWHKDFDAMALKTMLRQLISKWGAVSAQMCPQLFEAVEKDNCVLNPDGSAEYIGTNDIVYADQHPTQQDEWQNPQPEEPDNTTPEFSDDNIYMSMDDLA